MSEPRYGYEALANAIILQAVKDYRTALVVLDRCPKHETARYHVGEIELFFHGKWYGALTDVDSEYLISKLRKGNGRKRMGF